MGQVDIGRAFNSPFRDARWITKILIGAVMVIIPIFGWFCLAGYGLRIMRRVVDGADTSLPDWTDFGQLFVDGIKAWIVAIIWSLPTIILSGFGNVADNLLLQCLGSLVNIATGMLTAAAIVPVAISGDMADGLQFQAVVNRVLNNLGDYLLLIVMGFVLGLIAAAGAIACIIGVFASIAYALFVHSHLTAQAYRRSTGIGGLEPAPRF